MAITLDGTNGITTPDLAVDTNTLFVDAANNRVGVGTSAPNAKLELGGGTSGQTLLFSNTAINTGARLAGAVSYRTGSGYTAKVLESNITGAFDDIYDLRFFTANTGASVERMRIDSEGRVFRPNQPHCFVSLNGGDRTINVASYGVSDGGFLHQNGGFSLGSLINGFNVVHVPVTGWYRIDHLVYVLSRLNAIGARLVVYKNDAEELLFTQNLVNGDGTNFASKEVFLNANDYINYRGFGRDFSYFFATNHTMLGIHLIG